MQPEDWDPIAPRKKKKVDTEALNCSFMRIPGMKVEPARALLDIGLREVYELSGRAPEVLHEEWLRSRSRESKDSFLPYFRLAVYYAETTDPDPKRLSIHHWMD